LRDGDVACFVGMMSLLALAPLALAAAVSPAPNESVDQSVVTVDTGALRGARDGETWSFKGVPYAAPPLGRLRWRAPEPAPSWSGVRDASGFGYVCMQSATSSDPGGTPMGSEDCLTLNVWRPANAASDKKLPVLVFIHGGFFSWGASSFREDGVFDYDGAYLAEHSNAVVVTMNYRLGPFGFLAHKALSAESKRGSGDYALLDQIAALQWVKRNVAVFGGDPSHVMVFGQSAGAISVAMLVSSPHAKGLFSSALMVSGNANAIPLARAERHGADLANKLDCAGDDDAILACMREKSAASIIALGGQSFDPGQATWGPVVDGDVVPRDPQEVVERGEQNHVPLVVGVTSNEMSTMIYHYLKSTPVKTKADLNAALVARGWQKLARYYPVDDDARALPQFTAMLTDWGFTCPSRAFAAAASRTQKEPVRRYVYAHTFDEGPLAKFGAGHGMDLRLLFHDAPHAPFSAREEALSSAMIRYVARFAKTGDPNGGDDTAWPALSSSSSSAYLALDTPITTAADDRDAQCAIYEAARTNKK
jgi:para-nitrobenzyl esterase